MLWMLFCLYSLFGDGGCIRKFINNSRTKWDFFCEFLSDQHMKVLNNATSTDHTNILSLLQIEIDEFQMSPALESLQPSSWNLTSLFSTYRQIYCSNIDTHFSNIYTSNEYQKINRFSLERLSSCEKSNFAMKTLSVFDSLLTQHPCLHKLLACFLLTLQHIEEVSENHKNRKYSQRCCCRKHQKKADISSRSEIRLRLNWQTDARQILESCTDYTSDHILR